MSIYTLCLSQQDYRKLYRACPKDDRQRLFGKRPYAFLGPSNYRTLGGDPANEYYRPRTLSARPRTIRLTPTLQDRADTTFISPPREYGRKAVERTLESRKRVLQKLPEWVQALVRLEDIGGWVEQVDNPTRLFKYEESGGAGRSERWNVILGKNGKLPRANEKLYLVRPLADKKKRGDTVQCYVVSGMPTTKGAKRVKTASVILYPC